MVPNDDPTPPMRPTLTPLDADVIDLCGRISPRGTVPGISHLARIIDLSGRPEPRSQAPHPDDPGPDAA